MIFFSAHGVPVAYVEEAGDPYKAEMEECVDLIMEELEKRRINNAYTLAYQVNTQLLIYKLSPLRVLLLKILYKEVQKAPETWENLEVKFICIVDQIYIFLFLKMWIQHFGKLDDYMFNIKYLSPGHVSYGGIRLADDNCHFSLSRDRYNSK